MGVTPTVDDVRAAAERVRNRIADAGGDPEAVTLLAVTKAFPAEVAAVALEAGLVDLGENYAQELAAKAPVLDSSARWHFIGRLQRRRIREIAPHVTLWQSVDRVEVGEELARRAPGSALLVQVNVSAEPQKGGCEPAGVADLVARLTDLGLDVRGLMAVGRTGPPETARSGFALLRRLADDLDLPVRSMGMSGDLEAAVAEGSTMLRVGTDLVGRRPDPRSGP